MKNKKYIAVCGFPHSGTTITRRIIGDQWGVYEHFKETYNPPKPSTENPIITYKWIGLPIGHRWMDNDHQLVVVVRHPLDVFGSIYRRFGKLSEMVHHHQVRDYLQFLSWAEYIKKDAPKILVVKYEYLMSDYAHIYQLLDALEFQGPVVRSTPDREVRIDYSDRKIPDKEPDRSVHPDFRNWQINQPLENMTGRSAAYCPEEIKQSLKENYFHVLRMFNYEFI